jgi:hypothetical protein
MIDDSFPIADLAPDADALTAYDHAHMITYLRLLDAAAEGADWREACHLVLGLDPQAEPERAQRAHDSHLRRAQWMSRSGYRLLLTR